jgi:hypothetical protein
VLGILIALAPLLALRPAAGTETTSVEIITGEWSPYVSPFNSWPGASRDDAFGLATEILGVVLRQCRVSGDFRFLAWRDVLATATNRSALAFPYRHSQQRAEAFAFSEPLIVSRETLFFNPEVAPRLADAKDIGEVPAARIVFVEGYEYAPVFTRLRGNDAIEVEDERQAFEMVIAGKADGVIADERVGDHLLATFFPERGRLIERNEQVAAKTGLSVLFPKPLSQRHRDLLNCMDDHLSYLSRHSAQARMSAIMGLDQDAGFDVVLDGPSEYPVAVGTEAPDSEAGFLLPRGTRALVLAWDDAFVTRQAVGDRQLMYRKTQVKILDGPLRGRVLWVPNLFLRY